MTTDVFEASFQKLSDVLNFTGLNSAVREVVFVEKVLNNL